jgi:hypothetical protein|tara:strand:+ start:1914 stop:2462 length:549 start_codon:yes stop_codon:yes gene_type:complete
MSESVFAFAGEKLIAEGLTVEVKGKIQNLVDRQNVLVFDQDNGRQISLIFDQESASELSSSSEGRPALKNKPGRPKLGVVGREITLLPRHWEWLDGQRGGASATLRRLIDQCRAENMGQDMIRLAQDSTNRFIYAIAGNLSNFEEAVRALYGNNPDRFAECMRLWPADIRKCTKHYSDGAWG